jgi:hypothetical protein
LPDTEFFTLYTVPVSETSLLASYTSVGTLLAGAVAALVGAANGDTTRAVRRHKPPSKFLIRTSSEIFHVIAAEPNGLEQIDRTIVNFGFGGLLLRTAEQENTTGGMGLGPNCDWSVVRVIHHPFDERVPSFA